MTINLADNNPRVVYAVAEGVTQTVFAVPFEFFEDADVNVYVDGVFKAEGTDYTLTGGEGATGTLTFVPADPGDPQQVTGGVGGSTVILVRRIAIERTTDFQQGMDISRPALNSQLDVLTAIVADMNDRWDRAVHLDDADTGQVNFILPSSSLRAGNYFAFDANGDPVMTTGTTSDIIVSAFAETFLDDNDATQFFTTMGVTATAAELNFTDGVTSNIQTQLDAKALQSTTIATGTGLTGGGDLSASRTISPDIASQAEAEAGTASNKLMTPLRTAQAITALAPEGIGEGQTWQAVTRATNTSYQNTTGKPIMWVISGTNNTSNPYTMVAEVSLDNVNWTPAGQTYGRNWGGPVSIIVPNNYYYRQTGVGQTGDAANGVGWIYVRELR
jgi:hypothetical protein